MRRTACLLCLLFLCTSPSHAHPGVHEALEHFGKQIQLNPQQQSLYIQRGIIYSNDAQYQQAQLDFERAAELGDSVLVGFDFGVLYYRMAEFDTAKQYFDQFLVRFPNHAACLEYRARLARDSGNFDASIADFRRVFELQKQPNPGHYISAAQMLQTMPPDGTEQALAILDQANEKLGMTPQIQKYAITLELQRKQPEKAITRMLALEPILGAGPEWKVDLAELLLGSGRGLQANTLLDTASSQLDELRRTPAREQLRVRINELNTTAVATPSN
jgi:predicted Zn-dependent protease